MRETLYAAFLMYQNMDSVHSGDFYYVIFIPE